MYFEIILEIENIEEIAAGGRIHDHADSEAAWAGQMA
jgi:hypothetical protein